MPKIETNLSVCKRCGAVGKIKQSHCVFCGEQLDDSMQLNLKKDKKNLHVAKGTVVCNPQSERKKVTTISLLSVLFGALAVLVLALPIQDSGFVFGMVAAALAIVSFCQRKGGTLLAVLGIVLGGYTMFVNLFYFFWQFFYIFID